MSSLNVFGGSAVLTVAVFLPAVLMLMAATTGVVSVYLPVNATSSSRVAKSKTNYLDEVHLKRYTSFFKDDREIARYLKIYGVDLMLWRCKNAIQPYWNWKPLPYVELYCEVVGTIKYVSWYHNGKKIVVGPGNKFTHLVSPHNERGRYYSRWIDFRLRVFNATRQDAGIYSFTATSPGGYSNTQTIYVDISDKRKRNHPITSLSSSAPSAASDLGEREIDNAVARTS